MYNCFAGLLLLIFFIMPVAAEATTCPTTLENKDVCQNDEVKVDKKAECPVSLEKKDKVKNCKGIQSCKYDANTKTYSGGGTVTWKDESGKTTKVISKCEPNYAKRFDKIGKALQSENPEEALKIEEIGSLSEANVTRALDQAFGKNTLSTAA